MIRTIIVDDETKSREIVREILSQYCEQVEIVGEARSAAEAKQLIEHIGPDLVLLDIFMPNGTGFDLLQQISPISFEVIFITAYDEYAIQAVRSCALDYLLKPVNIMELREAIERARQKIGSKLQNKELQVLRENLGQPAPIHHKLAIPDKDGLRFVLMQQIVRMEADGSYTYIYMHNNEKILSTRHLKEYESILSSTVFFRAHHSHLINLEHIRQYQRGEGGTVIMSDNSAIQISKRKKKQFMDLFKL